MKKILGISLVSVLAVSPMMAGAANVTTIANVTANDDLATTSYVQGAYNVLGAAVNTKQDQLTNGTSNIVTTVKTAVSETAAGASDTSLVTEKAVFDAIAAAKQIIGGDTTAISEAMGDLDDLDSDIEAVTIVGAINEVSGDVAAEAARATEAESGLQDAIDTLNAGVGTAGSVDNKINAAITNVNTTTSGLDGRVTANTNAISTINNKTISYVTTWNQDATTTVTKTISQLPSAQVQGEEDDGEEESGN